MKEVKLKITPELDAAKLKADLEAALKSGVKGLDGFKDIGKSFEAMRGAAEQMAAAMKTAAAAATDFKKAAESANQSSKSSKSSGSSNPTDKNFPNNLGAYSPRGARRMMSPEARVYQQLVDRQNRLKITEGFRKTDPDLFTDPGEVRKRNEKLLRERERAAKKIADEQANVQRLAEAKSRKLQYSEALRQTNPELFVDPGAARKAQERQRAKALAEQQRIAQMSHGERFLHSYDTSSRTARDLLTPRGLASAGIDRLAPALGLSTEAAAGLGAALGTAMPIMGALVSGATAIADRIMAANAAGRSFADNTMRVSRILGNSFGESALTNTLLSATGNGDNPFSTITLNQIQSYMAQIEEVKAGKRKGNEQLALFSNAMFKLGIDSHRGDGSLKNVNDIIKDAAVALQGVQGSQRSAYVQDFAGLFGQDFANIIGLGPRLIDRLERSATLLDEKTTSQVSNRRLEETAVTTANVNAFNVAVSNAIGPIETFGQTLLGQAAAFGATQLNAFNRLSPQELGIGQMALNAVGMAAPGGIAPLLASFLGIRATSMQHDAANDRAAAADARDRQPNLRKGDETALDRDINAMNDRLRAFKANAGKLDAETSQTIKQYKSDIKDLEDALKNNVITSREQFAVVAQTNPEIAKAYETYKRLTEGIHGATLEVSAFNAQYAKTADTHAKLVDATANLEVARANAMQENAKGVTNFTRRYADRAEKYDSIKDDIERLDALAASYVNKQVNVATGKVVTTKAGAAPGKKGGPSASQTVEKAYWNTQRAAYAEQLANQRAAAKPNQGTIARQNLARINSDLADQRYAYLSGGGGGMVSGTRTAVQTEIRNIRVQRGLSKAEKARREKDLKQLLAMEEDMAQEGMDMVQNLMYDTLEGAVRDIADRIHGGEFGEGLAQKEAARQKLQSGSMAAREVMGDLTMRGMKETGVFDNPYSAFALTQQRLMAGLSADLRAKQSAYIASGGTDQDAQKGMALSGAKLQDLPLAMDKEFRRLRTVMDASQEERLTVKMLVDYDLVPPDITKIMGEKKKLDDLVKNMLNPTSTIKNTPNGAVSVAPSAGDVATARYQGMYKKALEDQINAIVPDGAALAGMVQKALDEKGAASGMFALISRHLNENFAKDFAGGIKLPSIPEIIMGVDDNTKVTVAADKKAALEAKFADQFKDLNAKGELALVELEKVAAVNVQLAAKQQAGQLASDQLTDLEAEGQAKVDITDLKLGALSGVDRLQRAIEAGIPNLTISRTATVNVSTTTRQINRLEKDDIVVPSGGGGGGGRVNSPVKSYTPSVAGSRATGGPSGRAIGGPVTRDRMYWVGENGPELFMPHATGSIINDAMSRRIGNSMTQPLDLNHLRPAPSVYNNHINIDARGSSSPTQVVSATTRAARQLFISDDPLIRDRNYNRRRGIF